jgi:murein DD-endopeptidase MepM/ murein hydrolase activator NlpD
MPTSRRLIIIIAAAAVLALAVLPALTAPAAAETAAEVQAKLRDARARIAAAKERKATLGDQIARLDSRLTSLDDEIARLGDQIASVEEKLTATREKLEVLRKQLRLKRAELQKAQEKLTLQQAYFKQRVVLSYKTSDLTYVDVVLGSSSFEDLVSRVNQVRELIGGDNDFVGELEAARDEVDREKRELAEKESGVADAAAELQRESDQLAALRAAEAASRAEALAARRDKGQTLRAVKTDLAELARQEDALLAQSRALSGVLSGSSGSGQGTGAMIYPVNGTITSGFGWRIHPILGVKKFHTGVDFGVPYGTPIKAADSGRVIYATWVGGYGNTVALDHGKGISTLYAHQSTIAVAYGASVRRGQVIGYVGSTGYSTGPHLHFEVRVNGNPVDPMGYL